MAKAAGERKFKQSGTQPDKSGRQEVRRRNGKQRGGTKVPKQSGTGKRRAEGTESEPKAAGENKVLKQSGRERRSEDGNRICQTRLIEIQFPVVMARGIHLFPYRTQKLSLSALMVLGWKRPGRVGRRRIPMKVLVDRLTPSFFVNANIVHPEESHML